ncbi:MAG: sulfatase-like hydrolase/transferase [Bacteriovoracaceae bacterium]|nr:sulfatase-like hydrolase/transferase [Bacteriovoracaceae bacterium]
MNIINLSPKGRWTIFYYTFALLVLTCVRLWLYIQNFSYFSDLGILNTLLAFFDGIRFDFSTLLIYTGLPSILLAFPIFKRIWYYPLAFINILMFVGLLFLLSSDLAFFSESQYHIGNHLLIVGSDLSFIIETALTHYLHFMFLISVIGVYMFRRMIRIWGEGDNFLRPRWYTFFPKFLILATIIFFGVNGKISKKMDRMISTSDAFSAGSIEYGNLVLNGGFTTFQVVKEKRWKNKTVHLDQQLARDLVKKVLSRPGTEFVDPLYPMLRKQTEFLNYFPKEKKINVMMILLESWSSEYIDFFSGKSTGDTPNFDKIASGGVSFTNFYPNGTMSLYGISSILTSLPPSPRVPALGKGLEVYNLMRPGSIFKKRGYYTFAAQSSIRVSFRFNTIAKYLGFSDYYGKEDYPRKHDMESPSNGWDDEMYDYLLGKYEKMTTPFFSFVFTGTTHIPYLVPEKKYEKYPHNPKTMDGFHNTLTFADSKLGEYMDSLKKFSWYDDTLFVFVADHTLHRATYGKVAKIPLVLYSPKYLMPQKLNTLGSQVDIIPTLFHMLHVDTPYSGIGKSLFGERINPVVMSERSRRVGLLSADGVMEHDIVKRISNSVSEDKSESYEQILLALEQIIWSSVEANRVHR